MSLNERRTLGESRFYHFVSSVNKGNEFKISLCYLKGLRPSPKIFCIRDGVIYSVCVGVCMCVYVSVCVCVCMCMRVWSLCRNLRQFWGVFVLFEVDVTLGDEFEI